MVSSRGPGPCTAALLMCTSRFDPGLRTGCGHDHGQKDVRRPHGPIVAAIRIGGTGGVDDDVDAPELLHQAVPPSAFTPPRLGAVGRILVHRDLDPRQVDQPECQVSSGDSSSYGLADEARVPDDADRRHGVDG